MPFVMLLFIFILSSYSYLHGMDDATMDDSENVLMRPLTSDGSQLQNNNHSNQNYWVNLYSHPCKEITNQHRSNNLELIVTNINYNLSNISKLGFIPFPIRKTIIDKLNSMRDHADDLYDNLQNISLLNKENKAYLQKQIDEFSDIEFDTWQEKFKKQVIELAEKGQQAQQQDYDQLLNLFNNINLS